MVYTQMITSKFWCETYTMYSVSETSYVYLLFVSWKIEAINHLILPLLLVPEWSYWPLNLKGLTFYKKINAILHKMLN